MNYRAWKTKQFDRANAVALTKQIAEAVVEKQVEELLLAHPEAEVSAAERAAALTKESRAAALLGGVLAARGVTGPEEIKTLLAGEPPLSDPFLLKDMDKAVERLLRAADTGETIVVFGDYDVDGVTATSLLYQHLKGMGADAKCMLPSREGEGYGLSRSAIQSIYDKGYRLIVTVDNGISAVEEAELAASLGIELVITDHHIPPKTLPRAVAVVDPRRPDDESPFKGLSGAGVAFKLCAALDGCPPEEMLDYCGDLAAIGTVADVMPLTGENRTIVTEGLRAIQNSDRPGLNALLEAAGLAGKPIGAENISFALAPRINAAGRMGSAVTALQLMLCEDDARAAELAEKLNGINAERQAMEMQITQAVDAQLAADPARLNDRVVLVWGSGWHQGVIGIVASRLVERTGRPVIVVTIDENGEGKGSGRSTGGFNLHSCIAACSDLLIRFGGHAMAAGLSVRKENLPALREAMNAWAAREYPVLHRPPLELDLAVRLDKLTVEAVQGLDRLAPFGTDNQMPLFLIENAVLDGVYPVSEGRHCRLRLRQGTAVVYAVYFGMSPAKLPYAVGDALDAAVTLSVYEGKMGLQLSGRIQELRPAGLSGCAAEQAALAEAACRGAVLSAEQRAVLLPQRGDIIGVYRLLQSGHWNAEDLQPMFAKLGAENTGKTMISLLALEQLGLVAKTEQEGAAVFCIVPTAEKKDLAKAPILKQMEESNHG